jgi:hypothetical protein
MGGAAAPVDSAVETFEDILAGNGGEVALSVGIPANMLRDIKPGKAPNPDVIPTVALMIRHSDGPLFPTGIHRLLTLGETISHSHWYATGMAGVPVRILGPATNLVRPVYAPLGDFDVFALSRASMLSPLYLSRGKNADHSLSASPAFQRMQRLLGGPSIAMFYFNGKSVMNIVAQSGALAMPTVPPAEQGLLTQPAHSVGELGATYQPDPLGLASSAVFTYDPNAL